MDFFTLERSINATGRQNPERRFNISGYACFCSDVEQNPELGEVLLYLTKTSFCEKNIPRDVFARVVVKILQLLKVTICSIYLSDATWNLSELKDLLKQQQTLLLLLEDFNANSPIWACTSRKSGV